jgi:pimeloyl-ACP methyl ester carboxylesterase
VPLPPVLLVHGFASSADHGWVRTGWVDILHDEGRTAVTVDMLGHGTAPRPQDPAAYAGLEGGVLEAVAEHSLVDAVGFSAGARLLLGLAARKPRLFRRIVLMGIGGSVLGPAEDAEPLARALTGEPDPEDVHATLFRRLARTAGNDPAALAAFLRRPADRLGPTELAAVTAPVLLVIGDRDPAAPADPLAAALPDATVRVLPGVDHFSTPADFGGIQAAVDFLNR